MSIASEISRLQSDSAAIASAIRAKGVTVPASAGYDDYARLIGQISGGGGGGSSFDDWVEDGNTHLWIFIQRDYQVTQYLRLRMVGTIVWGDGTSESINASSYTTKTHTYPNTGTGYFRIDLIPDSGTTFYLGGASSSYNIMGSRSNANLYRISALYQAEIGTAVINTLSNYAFYYCIGLRRVHIPKNITTFGSNTFNACYALRDIDFEDSSKITTATLTSNFYNCYNLQSLVDFLPAAGTAINSCVRNCYSLNEFTIQSYVTDIGANSFSNMYGLKKLYCKPTTPPTVADADAFTNFPASCEIIVPSGKLTAYQTANIWSTYASQMVEA